MCSIVELKHSTEGEKAFTEIRQLLDAVVYMLGLWENFTIGHSYVFYAVIHDTVLVRGQLT